MSKTILVKLWSKNPRLCRKYKKQPKPRWKHLEIGCFLVGMTGFEPATSWSQTLKCRFFPYFTRLFEDFESKNDAFRCSRSHCFHTVQVRRWSKVWSALVGYRSFGNTLHIFLKGDFFKSFSQSSLQSSGTCRPSMFIEASALSIAFRNAVLLMKLPPLLWLLFYHKMRKITRYFSDISICKFCGAVGKDKNQQN